MDSKKSLNSFEMRKDWSTDYLCNNIFFGNLLITFRHYYYAKYVFNFFNMVDFF